MDQLGRTEVDQLGRAGVDQLGRTQPLVSPPGRWTSLAELRVDLIPRAMTPKDPLKISPEAFARLMQGASTSG